MKIDFSNIPEFQKQIFNTQSKEIQEKIDLIHLRNQGFYIYIDNDSLHNQIFKFAKKKKNFFDYIVVLGIGGSALGTICIQQSLSHLYKQTKPELIVLDNIDPILIKETLDFINIKRTLFIVVTKSGETPETLSQYLYFRNLIESDDLDVKRHFLFITDEKRGLLREIANTDNIDSFPIPDNIGGRFSVLTAVGLIPAALIGVDTSALIDGAKNMREKFLSSDIKQNFPFQIAKLQYLSLEDKKTQNVMFTYNQKLIRFSDWYRQLLAESIGKEKNLSGKIVNKGLTPIHALGVTDQHSQAQLYNEGPNDKLFIFLSAENKFDLLIPKSNLAHASYLDNVSFDQLLKTEMQATRDALTSYNRPNIAINIGEIDAFNLGQLFMLFMGATAFLGEMLNINTYNQPGVELAKNLTRKYLSKK